ncbi:MAG: NAD(P)/FAD-dependent oxidoreductase [Candidatus Omnitrophota bacterium]
MRYTIIGSSAAGAQAAEELRALDKDSTIVVVSQEGHLPYSRCLISRYADGRLPESGLYFKTQDFFKRYGIAGILHTQVTKIDRAAKKLICENAQEIEYDKLLIAVGARPRVPKIDGLGLTGVTCFHSLDDACRVAHSVTFAKAAVVVGAGFIGLEAAYALARRGLKVTVIERCSQILPNQLDATASKIIQQDLEGLGVEMILNESIVSINGTDSVCDVTTADKTHIKCELVVIAAGITPNKELAEQAGLDTDKGILVDEFLRTSDTDIFAAGDCIEIQDISTGKRVLSATWFNAVLQAKFAARNMAGERRRYTGAVGIQNAVQFHQIPAISFGKTLIEDENSDGYEVVSIHSGSLYKKLVLKDNKIRGMIFVGDIAKSGFYAALIRHEVDVSKYRDKLLDADFSYAYFKDENFGQADPYQAIPACWESPAWWAERAQCMGIGS